MNPKDLNEYGEFVTSVTSLESKNLTDLIERYIELDKAGCDIARLDTAASGLMAESGEFMEIVKKIKFQKKPYNADNVFHMKRELGDIMFYWITGCIALGLNPYEVIAENYVKLTGRYPDGEFKAEHSENRKEGDL